MILKRMAWTALLGAALMLTGAAQHDQRTEIALPHIPGYLTLKADLHMHTVFSDGNVWPTIRVTEAWLEGLDAIAITDHVESRPHEKDVSRDLNRPHEIAEGQAKAQDILLIRGAEITRDMPPGHFNAIFLTDANALEVEDWRDSLKAAIDQGAFVFWNHPGWVGQQPDGVARWYDEHTELHEKGWLHGIEIVNYDEYYPRVHAWCVEKNLTLIGNSDIHDLTHFKYALHEGQHRPVTLIFALERSVESIKEALFAHRSAAYFENQIYGDSAFLDPLFKESIEIKHPEIELIGKGRARFQIANHSDLDFELELDGEAEGFAVTREIVLNAHRTALLSISAREGATLEQREARLPCKVNNLLVSPDQGLRTEIILKITQRE
jgi:hypothetical protein